MDLRRILSASAGILLALGGVILSLGSLLIELMHPPSFIPHTRPHPKHRRRSLRSLSVPVLPVAHSEETSESGHSVRASSTASSLDVHSVQPPPEPPPQGRARRKTLEHTDGNHKRWLFHRHSTGTLWRSDAASSASRAPRTDPYSAPYYFPLPGSREAERYAEKVRQEKKHLATIVGVEFVKRRSKSLSLKKRLSLL